MTTTFISKSILIFVLASRIVLAGSVDSGKVVVAGSSLEAPPPFWEDSFWGITGNIDRAFPFNAQPFGPYFVTELQVPVYHYEGLGGFSANFTIHVDDSGIPGAEIARFDMSGISTSQVVLSSSLLEPVLFESNERYWIVGSTLSGQVNWNLGDSTFGEAAFRVGDGEWVFIDDTNVSGFALLGPPVPEPSTLAFLALSGLVLRNRRLASRYRQKLEGSALP